MLQLFQKKFAKPNEKDKPCLDELLDKCEQNSLCPKQVTTDNRVIPYQLYYVELKKILENKNVRVTRIATGIPMGTDIEYIDAMTLEFALEGRKDI